LPARLNDCNIPFTELASIQYVDLFPVENDLAWREGVRHIPAAITVQTQIKQDETVKIKPNSKRDLEYNVNTYIIEKKDALHSHNVQRTLIERFSEIGEIVGRLYGQEQHN
jgi:hypothetical protein